MTPQLLMALVREWEESAGPETCDPILDAGRDATLAAASELRAALKAWAEHYSGDDNEWIPPKQIREFMLGVEEK